MNIMSIERFREIKNRIKQIADREIEIYEQNITLSQEEKESLEGEKNQVFNEIKHSDLSRIPKEEYKGFVDYAFNFEGTGANLDFSLIDLDMRSFRVFRGKGCNVTNFDFDNIPFDEDSFDEGFIQQHKDKFWGLNGEKEIPKEVRQRYYSNALTIRDLIDYDLFDKIDAFSVDYHFRQLFRDFSPEVLKQVDLDMVEKIEWNLDRFVFDDKKQKIENLDEFNQVAKKTLSNVLMGNSILEETYMELTRNSTVRALVPECIIDFPEGADDLRKNYFSNNLLFSQVYQNRDLFRGKLFANRLESRSYLGKEAEEQIFYIFDNYPEFTEDLMENSPENLLTFARIIDLDKTIAENTLALKATAKEFAEKHYRSEASQIAVRRLYGLSEMIESKDENLRIKYNDVIRHTTPERLNESGIPADVILSTDVLEFFRQFGFETIMEFNRENNNIFTRDDSKLLKNIYEHYIHYAGNDHDPQTSIYTHAHKDGEDKYTPYTKEEFEESVVRMMRQVLYGPKDFVPGLFSKEFRDRHRLSLPENTPDELKQKFDERTLTIEDFVNHPDWTDFMKDVDISLALPKTRIYTSDGKLELIDLMSKNYSGDESIRILLNNKSYIDFMHNLGGNYRNSNFHLEDGSAEDIDNKIRRSLVDAVFNRYDSYYGSGDPLSNEQKMMYAEEMVKFDPEYMSAIGLIGGIDKNNHTRDDYRKTIQDKITEGMKNGIIRYSPEKYPEFAKEASPNLFLDDNAPLELKEKFYTRETLYGEDVSYKKMEIKDLVKPEFKPFLEGKIIQKREQKLIRLLENFSREEAIEIAEIDPDAIEVYAGSDQNIKKLKLTLSVIPEKLAKEELMSAYGLSLKELDERLNADPVLLEEFNKAKDGFRKDVITSPGLILYGTEELTITDFRNYRNLTENNSLKQMPDFRRDVYEQILSHAYTFLGFDHAKRLFETPEMSPENIDEINEIDGRIKELYEKKFEITGSIKTIYDLLNGVPRLLPGNEKITSKNTMNVFKFINSKITAKYDGDVRSLLQEGLRANNFPENAEEIEALSNKLISQHTEMKLEKIREETSLKIEQRINENAKTKKMIKILYRNALKHSLNKSEKVDPNLVREYLENEFNRKTENGEPYYSTHVSDHLGDLIGFTIAFNEDPELSKIMNQTVVDCLSEESVKIGKGWIRKVLQVANYPSKMTYEKAIKLDQDIYGQETEHEVETKETVGLKQLTAEEQEKVYEVLRNANYAKLMTFNKAELMFSGLTPPYSEEFKKFFLKNKEEIISDPKYYTCFTKMHSLFDSIISDPVIKTRYTEGVFTLQNLLNEATKTKFNNVEMGDYELDYWGRKGGLKQEQFDIAKVLLKQMKEREASTVPPEEYKGDRFRGRIVRIDDPLHFAIGEITTCCQTIGKYQPGESSMVHSALEHNGALFVVEQLDDNGKPVQIVAQSWTWRNGNRVTFDNVEIPATIKMELRQIGGFNEIMDTYENAAKRMIETDERACKKLVEKGVITEEQAKQIVIKDIAMGRGCDDLISSLSRGVSEKYPLIGSVRPLEIDKEYEGSTKKELYTDAGSTILIAHNDSFEDHDFHSGEVIENGIGYTKIREIFRREGSDIDIDKIAKIKEMTAKNNRGMSTVFNDDVVFIEDVFSKLAAMDCRGSADNLKLSMSESADWFVLAEETPNGVMIHDSGIDLKIEDTNERGKIDKKMSLEEYTREILMIIADASTKNKKMIIDLEREGKVLPLEALKASGDMEVDSQGIVKVHDIEKIKARIDGLTQILEKDRRDRIISDIGDKKPESGEITEKQDEGQEL